MYRFLLFLKKNPLRPAVRGDRGGGPALLCRKLELQPGQADQRLQPAGGRGLRGHGGRQAVFHAGPRKPAADGGGRFPAGAAGRGPEAGSRAAGPAGTPLCGGFGGIRLQGGAGHQELAHPERKLHHPEPGRGRRDRTRHGDPDGRGHRRLRAALQRPLFGGHVGAEHQIPHQRPHPGHRLFRLRVLGRAQLRRGDVHRSTEIRRTAGGGTPS